MSNGIKSTDFSDKKLYVYVKESVLRFFLHTYKLQLGAVEQDPGKFIHVASQTGGDSETYELQVYRDENWLSRRMSIASLGDGTGSKSKCFKVFYDDILVVKIPPSPIRDFEKYIEGINAESRIASHLMPDVECIFPSVSALLRKIPPFSSEPDMFPEDAERKHIETLRQEPLYQQYLKIGDTFAFFMSLSKHSFFSTVMNKMHDRKNKFREQVMEQFDILWDALAFEEKYGTDKTSLFFTLSHIYSAYEKNVNSLARKYELPGIPIYKKKEWFLLHLAEAELEEDESFVPSEFVHELGMIFGQMPSDEKETLKHYRKTIADYAYHRNYEQNKTKAKGIIRNILKLIGALNRKGVAIRDLKPDNIFIIGDLRSAEYSMGLIDFETAVVFEPSEYDDISQPMMAGTPSYATPSHLFRNEILTEMLKDLRRVLHHQDWYAMIVMIYNTVIGERLFEETRKLLPKIGKIVHGLLPEGMTMQKLFAYCSRNFWQNARSEFSNKTLLNKKMLENTEVSVPEETRQILRQEALDAGTDSATLIRSHIRSQNIFRSEKSHQDLLRSSHKMILQCRVNWERGVNVPKSEPEIRLRIISFLRKLEELKSQYDERRRYKELLDKSNSQISVLDLLNLMFGAVFKTMYKPEWEDADGVGETDFEVSSQISYEKTISVEEISTEETMSYEKTLPEEGD